MAHCCPTIAMACSTLSHYFMQQCCRLTACTGAASWPCAQAVACVKASPVACAYAQAGAWPCMQAGCKRKACMRQPTHARRLLHDHVHRLLHA
eukprot:28224-Chlamydomonas_euryale.AAC.2